MKSHWLATVRMIEEEMPQATRRFHRAISEQIREAIRDVARGDDPTLGTIDLQKAWFATAGKTAQDFAERTYNKMPVPADVASASGRHTRKLGDKAQQAILGLVTEFINEVSANRVRQIHETTVKWIRAVLLEATEEGYGPREAARHLRKRWEGVGRARAERIARTELAGAANRGSLMGAQTFAKEHGLTLKKTWVAAFVNTRDSHAEAHGQTRAVDESFEVGGHSLRYPGDQIAPPGETVNCMCTIAYEVE